jgi:hypothetical protein
MVFGCLPSKVSKLFYFKLPGYFPTDHHVSLFPEQSTLKVTFGSMTTKKLYRIYHSGGKVRFFFDDGCRRCPWSCKSIHDRMTHPCSLYNVTFVQTLEDLKSMILKNHDFKSNFA